MFYFPLKKAYKELQTKETDYYEKIYLQMGLVKYHFL